MNEKTHINLIGIYLIVFLISLITLSILTFILELNNSFIKSLIIISCSGGLGGTIYSIRGYYQHLGVGDFNINWTWWYLFRPIISTVIGVFVYFLIYGGLIILSSTPSINYPKGAIFYSALAFLAGFSFTQFANKLEEIASTLFTKKEERK